MVCSAAVFSFKQCIGRYRLAKCCYCTSQRVSEVQHNGTIQILGNTYQTDHMTNIRPSFISKIGKNLHNMKYHPLNLLKKRIENHFYNNFFNRHRNPLFSVYDTINPIVTLQQNFDSLLVPAEHSSRNPSESFYLNSQYMLRAHTSAHQSDLIRTGLDAFLLFGDVYRRDSIDSSHFPVFHQADGVRLFTVHEVNTIITRVIIIFTFCLYKVLTILCGHFTDQYAIISFCYKP
jgi:phenylalanyl-tRNA synthetase alpha chain